MQDLMHRIFFLLFRFKTQTPQPNTLLTPTYTQTQTRINRYRSLTISPHVCKTVPARFHPPPPAIPERPRAAHLACTSTPYTFRPPAPPVRTGTADAERRSRRPWCRPRMVCGKVAGVPLGIGSRFRPPHGAPHPPRHRWRVRGGRGGCSQIGRGGGKRVATAPGWDGSSSISVALRCIFHACFFWLFLLPQVSNAQPCHLNHLTRVESLLSHDTASDWDESSSHPNPHFLSSHATATDGYYRSIL